MNRSLISAIGALIGAVVGYFTAKKFGAPPDVTIRLFQRKPRCWSHTHPQTLRARRGSNIDWEIVNEDCPGDPLIDLQFENDDSPVQNRRPRGRRRINDRVRGNAHIRTYKYTVYLIAADGTRFPMEDPEIQIEF